MLQYFYSSVKNRHGLLLKEYNVKNLSKRTSKMKRANIKLNHCNVEIETIALHSKQIIWNTENKQQTFILKQERSVV